MIATARLYVELATATNYISMGEWNPEMEYQITEIGIPIVTIPDGTSAGFSAYALSIEASTPGAHPSSAGQLEWRLVESVAFIYMLQAYIEKLQAQVITAEYIEALNIRTGNLEVLDGSKLGGFSIRNNRFVSHDEKIELDGETGQIILRDPNTEDIRTIIRPVNLPTTPDAYFGSGGSATVGLSSLTGAITSARSVDIKTVAAGDENAYEVSIPSFTITAEAQSNGPSQGLQHLTEATVRIGLYRNGTLVTTVASVSAMGAANSGWDSRTITIQPAVLMFSGAGTWSLRSVLQVKTPPTGSGWSGQGQGSISGGGNAVVSQIVDRSEIGSNGMVVATSSQNYTYDVGGLYQVRRGNIGFQITNAGIKKSSNMNNSFPTWTDI